MYQLVGRASCTLALALVAGACAGGASDGALSGDPVPTPNPDLVREAEALGFSRIEFGDLFEEEAERVFHERLQICMTARGFEYFPPTSFGVDGRLAPGTVILTDGRTVSHEDMAELYGFGVVENVLIFIRDPAGETAAEADPDPNFAYVDTLSETAQEAYWFAMDDDATGCTAVVQASFEPPSQVIDYDSLVEAAYEDPRISDFVDNWVRCMRDQGYSYDDPSDPIDEFEERIPLLLEEINSKYATDPESFADAQQEQIESLERLQAQEITVAVASEACGGTAFENQRLLDTVMLELQAKE